MILILTDLTLSSIKTKVEVVTEDNTPTSCRIGQRLDNTLVSHVSVPYFISIHYRDVKTAPLQKPY